MIDKINKLLQEVEEFTALNKEQLEEYRIKWISKKGEISILFDEFKSVPNELKKRGWSKAKSTKK